jgi:hypothetical protein
MIKKTILPVVLATIWISISEFVRNEFILKSYWTDHYEGMGLFFLPNPSMEPFGEFGHCALPLAFILSLKNSHWFKPRSYLGSWVSFLCGL